MMLVVEDDSMLAEFLGRVLAEEGVGATLVGTLADARKALKEQTFDAIVLDWMLPDGDGLSLCEELVRQPASTPILMLTARGEVADRVRGLRHGADDYLTKPFEVEELLARLDALVRRTRGQRAELQIGPMVLNRVTQRVWVGGTPLELKAKEFALLALLAQQLDRAVDRPTLFAEVWGLQFDPGSGVLDVCVSRLRDKLGEEAWRIETVRGVGYRLRSTR